MMKTLVAIVLGILVVGCATPTPSAPAAPSMTPTAPPSSTSLPTPAPTPSPSPTANIAWVCLSPDYCSDVLKDAVLEAVASLGHPVRAVTIGPFNLHCGGPFPSGTYACPLMTGPLAAAYVTFEGTDKVAAVEIGTVVGGPGVDSVVAFKVPPAGWSMP